MPRRKIPTKAELIQLQKLYKTDERIAERLGNVSPQLVAYWRRKKNIPKHSFPKFSESEIRDLWEQYGDDYRCGLDLGISKAAFYNWRRKYGIKEKPSFLKLEQLELDLGGPHKLTGKRHQYGRQTVSQKILAERAGLERIEVGQTIEVEPDLALSYDDSADIIDDFQKRGHSHVWNPSRVIISQEHSKEFDVGDRSTIHKKVKEFVRKQNIKNFSDILEGICHQNLIENGRLLPGQLAVGSNRYIASQGCIGAYATAISTSEMTDVWTNGRISLQVPQAIGVIVNGKIHRGVYARDVIMFIIGKLTGKTVDSRAVEFYGSAVSHMSISERFTLTNTITELGIKSAICSFDSTTRRYLSGRTKMPFRPALADKDAIYNETYEFNVDQLIPQVACPDRPDNVKSVAEIAGLPINQVVIGMSSNGRLDDLRIVADIIKGKKIDSEVRLLIIPSSQSVYLDALKKGFIRAFIESGAMVINPGCASFLWAHGGILAAGERCLSTTSRNFQGAMGSDDAEIYLVSPATAAASALKGVITDPTGYVK
jgi:3-isopropylmalate/(R)-2-methylmalate dehydratase large subunit